MPYWLYENDTGKVQPVDQLIALRFSNQPIQEILLLEGCDPNRPPERQPLAVSFVREPGVVGGMLVPAEQVGDGLWFAGSNGAQFAVAHTDWPPTSMFGE